MTDPSLQSVAARRRRPESTYRLQFHAGFTFKDAAAIAPYLRDLGITHVYASPYLKARAGSTHGYDIIDHCQLNPELGTQADFDAFVKALTENGLSQILDTVPNHVGVATNDNTWWNDVLEHGPASRFGNYFDIAWQGSPRPELHHKVLIPTLGEPYGKVLEQGQLKLSFDGASGAISLSYFDRRFPINRESFLRATSLPPNAPTDQIETAVAKMNGKPGEPRSFDALDKLLEAQSYRLSFWRVASDEINYRRFFDINDLAALSMEREEVFDATHVLIFKLLENGTLTGLRVDHPDGLYDPKQYFERLQKRFEQIPSSARGSESLYVVAEKILAFDEPLPEDWAVDGTSGYDFLNYINGLFVNPSGEEPLTRSYAQRIAPGDSNFADMVYRKKLLILDIALASELNMLAHQLDRLAQRNRNWRDFTLNGLRHALRETIACFGVYRTYITDEGIVSAADKKEIESAIQRAIERNPKTDASVFHFLRDVLLLKYPDTFDEPAKAAQRRFAGKFQQVTAPVTAKGIEDTAFYIYNRFISLNEVGGDPDHFGVDPAALHAWLADRQAKWPFAMSSLSTHDTKRSEDVRARLNVLSEIPDQWTQHVERWLSLNESHRQKLESGDVLPSLNDEYLLYQTLVGAWPFDAELSGSERETFVKRIVAYMTKAMRESKVNTSWTNPNDAYEKGVSRFVELILHPNRSAEFLKDFMPFQRKISSWGVINSLSQTLLRLAAPGVPDTYQGTELWDLSLVDPDNRRPVDYAKRQSLLARINSSADLPATADDPSIKLLVVARMLQLRRDNPGLFSNGEYLPLSPIDSRKDHLFAFARRHQGKIAIVAVSRFAAALKQAPVAERWEGAGLQLPPFVAGRTLRNIFTGETVTPSVGASPTLPAAALFHRLPVALLIAENVNERGADR